MTLNESVTTCWTGQTLHGGLCLKGAGVDPLAILKLFMTHLLTKDSCGSSRSMLGSLSLCHLPTVLTHLQSPATAPVSLSLAPPHWHWALVYTITTLLRF